jgi:FG-GAP-like repeat
MLRSSCSLVGALLLLGAPTSAQLAGALFSRPAIEAGNWDGNWVEVAVGDIDLDGVPDAALGTGKSTSVGIALGQGQGGFAPPSWVAGGGQGIVDIALADVDGDGQLDVVTGTNGVQVLHGLGGAAFAAPQTVVSGSSAGAVAVADLDLDGRLDIVAGQQFLAQVTLALQQPGGSFAIGALPVPTNAVVIDVLPCDLDADGDPDLAACGGASGPVPDWLRTFENQSGQLALKQALVAVDVPFAVVAADFDGDGQLDLATANDDIQIASFFKGLGAGQLAAPLSFTAASAPANATCAAAGDFNEDGRPDLALADFQENGVRVLAGTGTGAFTDGGLYVTGVWTHDIAAADLDGDGHLDVLASNNKSVTATTLLGRGDGTFGSDPILAMPSSANELAITDLDLDGQLDTVVTSDHLLISVLGDGHGQLAVQSSAPTIEPMGRVIVADMNSDGLPDAIAGGWQGHTQTFLGQGGGTLALSWNLSIAGGQTNGLAAGDYDGDGLLDLATTSAQHLHIWHGLGNGTYTDTGNVPLPSPYGLQSADFDHDGRLDLAVTEWSTGSVVLLRNSGGSLFGAVAWVPVGSGPTCLVASDLNGDGELDLVTSNTNAPDFSVTVLAGDGAGGLSVVTKQAVGEKPQGLVVADLNGDQRPDIASANWQHGTLSVLLGLGGLRFNTGGMYTAGFYSTKGLAAGDLDSDGQPELLTAGGAGLTRLVPQPVAASAWSFEGFALAGVAGLPQLLGTGTLEAGSAGGLTLSLAAPSKPAMLFIGLAAAPTPFKGGTLVPGLLAHHLLLITSPTGKVPITWSAWPAGVSGQELHAQYAIVDPAAIHGVALSNAVSAVVP